MPFQKNVFIHFECKAFLTTDEYERLEATMWKTLFQGQITELAGGDGAAPVFAWNRIN